MIEKLSKHVIPNFVDEKQVRPSAYHRFIPQDPSDMAKSHLISEESNLSTDNSYIPDIKFEETLL